ncbi:MAG: hypothetical protein WC082_02165 [Victivallales bacterium]
MKVKLVDGAYAEEPCVKYLEVDSKINLYELHLAILEAIDFENDHLFEFFIGRNCRNRSYLLIDEDDFEFDPEEVFFDIRLEGLFTGKPKGMKLIYNFDFGDNWMFEITKTRCKAKSPEPDTEYPRLVKSEGTNPVQYPSYED